MKIWQSVAVACALFCAAPAYAQTVNSDEVVVTGQRVREAIRDFVTQLSVAPTGEDQIPRWDRRICPGVVGIRGRHAQFLVDRLAERAFNVDLEVGAPGCQPNVLIFVTPDADTLARELVDEYPDLVGYFGEQDAQTRGRAALEEFANSSRPVRWWHVAQTVTRDGQVLGAARTQPTRGGGFRGAQVVRTTHAGRLESATRQDFNRVLIIVDANRAAGVSLDALGDYIAMVALAQLDPDADISEHDTILNLFGSAGATPAALTDWDVAYLQSLYATTRNAPTSQRQEAEISRRMNGELTGQ